MCRREERKNKISLKKNSKTRMVKETYKMLTTLQKAATDTK
jgi:hypothetical protein